MKNVLKSLLIVLLWLNGITAITSGIRILYHLHYASWLNDFFLPGVLLFILLGAASIVLTFFVNKHPLLLVSCALTEGMCLVFALTEQEEIFHRLHMLFLLLAMEGLILIITATLMMAISGTSPTKA